ncbi:10723_t:CDS:2, partial [Gigaspora margarita]
FDHDSYVGSTCGEIKVDLNHKCRNLLNSLVAFQNFEYKISNILDKSSESVLVISHIFKDETMHVSGTPKTNIIEANMYLAEDRILSFELATKKHEK